MNIEPAIIYTAFGGVIAAIVALWAVHMADHRDCKVKVAMLTEHTIAQQLDISGLLYERRQYGGAAGYSLESEKTAFFKKHMR